MQLFNWLRKGLLTLISRLQTQGLRVTLIWLYARGLPILTGIPIMKYSRITPNIYVGPQFRQSGKHRLEALGISASLNLRAEFDDRARHLEFTQHCYLPTEDDHAPTLAQLEQGIQFIQQITGQAGSVYIHCRGGIGRAPTMTAAYLIDQGATLDEAICLIRKSRPFIKIMPLQMQRLTQFETIKRTGT
jgi:protein-tyrosine phosphatase